MRTGERGRERERVRMKCDEGKRGSLVNVKSTLTVAHEEDAHASIVLRDRHVEVLHDVRQFGGGDVLRS
jgi:hypothetical protein